MNYLDKRKLIKSGYNLPILGFGAAPFMLSNNNVNNNSSAKTVRPRSKSIRGGTVRHRWASYRGESP